jgi:hypothetical protein
MISRRSLRRGGLRVVMLFLALLAFGVGAADLGIFGIHEHEAAAATHTSAPPDDGGAVNTQPMDAASGNTGLVTAPRP